MVLKHKDIKVGDRFQFQFGVHQNIAITIKEIKYGDQYIVEFKSNNGTLTRNLSLNDIRKTLKKVE